MRPLAATHADPVFLIRQPRSNTWFAMHDMTRISRLSRTMVVGFAQEAHARQVAHSLVEYRSRHGYYPSRDVDTRTKRFMWLQAAEQAAVLNDLDVVEMHVQDMIALAKGNGMHVRVVSDPEDMRRKMDILFTHTDSFKRSLAQRALASSL